ncbi:MAG: zinc ribbon domain-containing protein [Bryobacteraceae bacterium]
MTRFCGSCGSALSDTATFCGNCGADAHQTAQPNPPTVSQPSLSSSGAAQTKSNSGIKIVVAVVAIIFVGGILALGGVFYAAHKVSQKAHEFAARATGGEGAPQSSPGMLSGTAGGNAVDSRDSNKISGNPCRFLSVDEVSRATGVKIIRAEPSDDGCAYIAHGDPADATSKHMTAMLAKKGADAKTQQMMQKFSGAFFAQQEAGDKNLSAEAAKGEITPLAISFEMGHGAAAMRLNQKVMGNLGSKQEITGVGDEAFDSAEGMMTVRKGDNLIRFMYLSCPCNSDAIKPLAQKVAAAM